MSIAESEYGPQRRRCFGNTSQAASGTVASIAKTQREKAEKMKGNQCSPATMMDDVATQVEPRPPRPTRTLVSHVNISRSDHVAGLTLNCPHGTLQGGLVFLRSGDCERQ